MRSKPKIDWQKHLELESFYVTVILLSKTVTIGMWCNGNIYDSGS